MTARRQERPTYLIGFAELLPVEIKFADVGVGMPFFGVPFTRIGIETVSCGIWPWAQKETTTSETVRLHPASPLQCGRWGGEPNYSPPPVTRINTGRT